MNTPYSSMLGFVNSAPAYAIIIIFERVRIAL
jgi:hypothetical protein